MTEEQTTETEESKTEEETEEENEEINTQKRQKKFNNIFRNIKKFLNNIGKYNNDYNKTIFKNKNGTYIQERFIDWIYNTYKGNGKLNHEYDTDIDKIKGLYDVLENIKEDINGIENDKDHKDIIKSINFFKDFYKKYGIEDLKTKSEQQSEGYEIKIGQQQQQHEQEIKQQQQQHEQDIAERNRIENERAANIKHKAYEEGKEEGSKHSVEEIKNILAEDRRMEAERNQAQKDYIMSKVRDGIYKLPKQKIVEIVKKDIEDKKITTDDPEKMADTIYWESVKFINKHKRTIARLSTLQGYNPTQFEQLPPTVHQAVNDYITNKWEEDIARKNRKYLLPKDLPRWERAVQQHNVNPMLGRGAWSN